MNESQPKTETVYKIRRKDGLFSTGGTTPSFTKKGKVWRQRGHVSNHLAQMHRPESTYCDCELVEYQLIEAEVGATLIAEAVAAMKERKDERKRRHKEWVDAYLKNQRRLQYEALQKEFGNA